MQQQIQGVDQQQKQAIQQLEQQQQRGQTLVQGMEQQQQRGQQQQQLLQQEMAKRSAEHAAAHAEYAQMRLSLDTLEEAVEGVAAKAQEAHEEAGRAAHDGAWDKSRQKFDPEAGDRAKKLDRFATDQAKDTFNGEKQGAGLRHWVQEIRNRAAYAAEALGTAMNLSERAKDPITPENLLEWGVDERMDCALRMALHTWTTGTAQAFIGNTKVRGQGPHGPRTRGLASPDQGVRPCEREGGTRRTLQTNERGNVKDVERLPCQAYRLREANA